MIQHTPIKELFHVGNFTIYLWGTMFVVAFLLGFFLVLREAKRKKIDEKHIYNIALLVLIGAIAGGRLFSIFDNFGFYMQNPGEILALGHGGMASYGGIAFALLFAWLYVRKQKLRFAEILDLFAPYVALSLAVGRIGCFLNWCCYGVASSMPWAIQVAGDVPRHPTQIYELITGLIVFFILIKIKGIREAGREARHTKSKAFGFDIIHEKSFIEKPGALFLLFLALYSAFRFATDFMRDYSAHWLGLALSQWFCIGIFLFSAIALFLQRK